jgi:hypothetical protein
MFGSEIICFAFQSIILYPYIYPAAIVRFLFIKTWKYGTFPALIDTALSVNLLIAQTIVYTTGCFYTQ